MATDAKTRMTRENTLNFALDYVTNDRNVDNGDPEDNFGSIAELWTFWLEKKYGITFKLTATDVAMLSIMIKIARLLVTETKHDNWIDIAGYAACGAETAGIEERPTSWPTEPKTVDGGVRVTVGAIDADRLGIETGIILTPEEYAALSEQLSSGLPTAKAEMTPEEASDLHRDIEEEISKTTREMYG